MPILHSAAQQRFGGAFLFRRSGLVSEESGLVSEERSCLGGEFTLKKRLFGRDCLRFGGDLISITHLINIYSCSVFRFHNGEKLFSEVIALKLSLSG